MDVTKVSDRKARKEGRVVVLFFFFQAEDGIRDLTVTGVQTCALPISLPGPGRTTASSVHWLVLPGPGNVGRNSGRGPAFADIDLRVAKRFVLREQSKGSQDVELRLDAFNLLNHVNYLDRKSVV